MRTRRLSDPKASYESYLRRKVEAGRASMRAGRGQPNDKVEAAFAARRKRLTARRT
jgi:hypothetical protein